jgi:hypothetical protein
LSSTGNTYRFETEGLYSSVKLGLTILLLLGLLTPNVAGVAYYSLKPEQSMSVTPPPVELHEGTAQNCTSTIYANQTSAKVSVNGTGDYNYVLNFTEKSGGDWEVRLRAFNESILDGLNCSIYIYDGANSTQIIVQNGSLVQGLGPSYGLNASDTECIWMHVETSETGISYIYAYLEILIPETTAYVRYVIAFEIIS